MLNSINGHVVKMNTTHPLHYGQNNVRKIDSDDVSTSFQKVFMNGSKGTTNTAAMRHRKLYGN